jgi:hypothetical protein
MKGLLQAIHIVAAFTTVIGTVYTLRNLPVAPLPKGSTMKQYTWSEVYRIALLELDSSKILERITLARKTLKARMQELSTYATAERQAILDALNALQGLELSEIGRKRQRT